MPNSENECREMIETLDRLGKTYADMLVRLADLLVASDQFIHRAIRERGLWRRQQAELGKQQKMVRETIRAINARLDGSTPGDEWKSGTAGETGCED